MPTRSIENLKNQIKPCLCKKNDANAVVFPAIFTAKQDSLVLQKHIVFVFATVAKDITNLRHMANIFAFGDVAHVFRHFSQ